MVAWGMGLLVLALFPFVSSIVSASLMIGIGRAQRRNGPLAAENGRHAANLGLSYLLATVLLVGGHFLLLHLMTKDGPESDFFPLGIPITIWGAYTLAYTVCSIVGMLRASGRRVFRALAIPFFRS